MQTLIAPEGTKTAELPETGRKALKLGRNKTGLVLAIYFGVLHALWSLLVAMGVAQALTGWIFRLHFLSNPFQVDPFNAARAAMLVVVTASAGYLFGWLLALIWNAFHES